MDQERRLASLEAELQRERAGRFAAEEKGRALAEQTEQQRADLADLRLSLQQERKAMAVSGTGVSLGGAASSSQLAALQETVRSKASSPAA